MKYGFLFAVAILLTGCGGGSSSSLQSQPPTAQLGGSWEFVATSSTSGQQTLVETNLTQAGTAVAASDSQTALVNPLVPVPVRAPPFIDFLNNCGSQSNITATLNGNSVSFNLASLATSSGISNDTASITGTETLSANGQTSSGTYTESATSPATTDCWPQTTQTGTFVGRQIPAFSGTWSGVLWGDGTNFSITSQESNYVLTISGTANGVGFILTGAAIEPS